MGKCLAMQKPCLHQELARLSLPQAQMATSGLEGSNNSRKLGWPTGRWRGGPSSSSWKKAEDKGQLALSGNKSQAPWLSHNPPQAPSLSASPEIFIFTLVNAKKQGRATGGWKFTEGLRRTADSCILHLSQDG